MKEGYDAIKSEYDANFAILDWAAIKNPKAVMSWIEGELLSGKFLVLPAAIYKKAIKICRENGMSEDAIKNIHESQMLKPY